MSHDGIDLLTTYYDTFIHATLLVSILVFYYTYVVLEKGIAVDLLYASWSFAANRYT